MVANQPAGSTMSKDFYEAIIGPALERLAHKFETLMDEGKLKGADPSLAVMHWKGLVDSDFFERRLLGVIEGPDPQPRRAEKREEREAGVSRSSREGMKRS